MQLSFTKMHGIGNDYIYVNCLDKPLQNPEQISQLVSDRHFGIGSDGLVLICPSQIADFRMRMFNADGSEGNMCGNAIRCVGKYVYDRGLTNKTAITIETKSGVKSLKLDIENGKVQTAMVNMGKAILNPKEIPVDLPGETCIDTPLLVNGEEYAVTCVSMGNPHAVVFVEDTDSLELAKIGPQFEFHSVFPDRVNTEFVQFIDEKNIKMRVWERGSGETFACGTGACASVVACVLNHKCPYNTEITVHLRGGDLFITYRKDGTVLMRGSATHVFDGVIDL